MPPDPRQPREDTGADDGQVDENLDEQIDESEAEDELLEADALEDDESGDADAGDPGKGAQRRDGVLDDKRQRSNRRNEDIRAARDRAQAAEASAAEAKAQAAAIQAQLNAIQNQRDEAGESARLELLSESERSKYYVEKGQRSVQMQLAQQEFRLTDQSDKLSFEAMCRADPRAKKLAPEVERRLTELRGKGQNVSRENLLAFVIGKRALDNPQVTGKQRAGAERRREREQARGTSPRGDAQGQRRAAGKTPAQRLEGVLI